MGDIRDLRAVSWDTKAEIIFNWGEGGREFWKAELPTFALENENDPACQVWEEIPGGEEQPGCPSVHQTVKGVNLAAER